MQDFLGKITYISHKDTIIIKSNTNLVLKQYMIINYSTMQARAERKSEETEIERDSVFCPHA